VRDGGTKHGSVSVHPDPRVQAVLEQEREAEMWQAIDRLRLNIPVDELVTWKQLIGDRRLSDAPAECDAKGWDAPPLAPWELSRLFP
jgi:hypothetical protein